MKFKLHRGLIWVSAILTYENTHYQIDNCIIDTGAATTAIDIDCIPFNYTKPATVQYLCGIGGGKQEVVVQSVDALTIADQVIRNVPIEFGDLNIDYGINGFIGTDILGQFDLSLLFSNRTLSLYKQPTRI